MTNEDRLAHHLTSEFGTRSVGSLGRDELQAFLDRKGEVLSFSVVDHLRWDLKRILNMAVAEGYLRKSPAVLQFTPRDCRRTETQVTSIEEVRKMLSVLQVRAPLIAKLALLAGVRPGEIFGLKWARMEAGYADIRHQKRCRFECVFGLPVTCLLTIVRRRPKGLPCRTGKNTRAGHCASLLTLSAVLVAQV